MKGNAMKSKANKATGRGDVGSGDWLGRCVTHHHSCDCRERAIRALLEEVIWWHSDPTLHTTYNGCDTDPCRWCECAKGLLDGTMNHDEIVKAIGRPNVPNSATGDQGASPANADGKA
jgi:hypothetical protein